MEIELELVNKTKQRITRRFIYSIVFETLKDNAQDLLEDKTVEISVALVAEDEMHTINKSYRQKDKTTDVLSFYEFETSDEIKKSKEKKIFIGELIVCPNYIQKKADKLNIPFEDEFIYVVSHGIMHLLGFEHGKKMFKQQQNVVNKLSK